MNEVDVLILGAGAAGLMCAAEAGRRGRRTLVLDHADRPGKKLLISGGGRANFTNLNTSPANFLSANPHFAKSALARFTPLDFVELIEKHRIPYHEKTLGQLFCSRSAHDLLNLLLAECEAAHSRIQLSTSVLSVTCPASPLTQEDHLHPGSEAGNSASHPHRFLVETSRGPIATQSLVVATGGLSIPKLGATSLGYDLAAQFGHPIVAARPALVPFVLSPPDQADWCSLAGVSTEVIASIPTAAALRKQTIPAFREKLLITHRGLSGPAILQISSYWQPGQPISLDLAPNLPPLTTDPASLTLLRPHTRIGSHRSLADVSHALRTILPARFADRWMQLYARAHPTGSPMLSNQALFAIEHALRDFRIIPAGTEGFSKAEVTAGGVSTDSLDARTLQSRLVPGLYFIGEVVDVTGWLGGYNFQWAWASAVAAGKSA